MPTPLTPPRRLTCLHCGNDFIAPRRRGQPPRFCSPEHRTAYRTAEQKDRRRIAAATPSPPPKTAARREAEAMLARVRAAEWARDDQARKEIAEAARAIRAVPSPRTQRVGEEYEATRLPDTWTARDLAPVLPASAQDVAEVLASGGDAAFAWLAATHPDESADFPRAPKIRSTAPPVLGDVEPEKW